MRRQGSAAAVKPQAKAVADPRRRVPDPVGVQVGLPGRQVVDGVQDVGWCPPGGVEDPQQVPQHPGGTRRNVSDSRRRASHAASRSRPRCGFCPSGHGDDSGELGSEGCGSRAPARVGNPGRSKPEGVTFSGTTTGREPWSRSPRPLRSPAPASARGIVSSQERARLPLPRCHGGRNAAVVPGSVNVRNPRCSRYRQQRETVRSHTRTRSAVRARVGLVASVSQSAHHPATRAAWRRLRRRSARMPAICGSASMAASHSAWLPAGRDPVEGAAGDGDTPISGTRRPAGAAACIVSSGVCCGPAVCLAAWLRDRLRDSVVVLGAPLMGGAVFCLLRVSVHTPRLWSHRQGDRS